MDAKTKELIADARHCKKVLTPVFQKMIGDLCDLVESADAEVARLREALEWMVSFMPDPNLDKDSIQAAAVNQARIVLNSPDFKIYDVPTGYPYQEKYKRPSALSPIPEPEPFKAGQKWRTSRGTVVHLVSSFEGSPVVGKCWICQTENGVQDHFPEYYMRERWSPIPAPEGSNG